MNNKTKNKVKSADSFTDRFNRPRKLHFHLVKKKSAPTGQINEAPHLSAEGGASHFVDGGVKRTIRLSVNHIRQITVRKPPRAVIAPKMFPALVVRFSSTIKEGKACSMI